MSALERRRHITQLYEVICRGEVFISLSLDEEDNAMTPDDVRQ